MPSTHVITQSALQAEMTSVYHCKSTRNIVTGKHRCLNDNAMLKCMLAD